MGKVLVIVDVQKEFDEYIQHDLVDALSKYAENFDTVYQIWDTHNNTVAPTHSFPGQVDSVPKKYGKKHFSEEVTDFIKSIEDSSDEGRTFKLSDDEGYVVRVDNNHDWFYVNPEIVELISKLKGNKVILAGGADGECLEDVYQTFVAFGLNVHINKKYTYSAKTSEEDSIEEVQEKLTENVSNYPYKKIIFGINSEEEAEKIILYLRSLFPSKEIKNIFEREDIDYPNWLFIPLYDFVDEANRMSITKLDNYPDDGQFEEFMEKTGIPNGYDPVVLSINDLSVINSIKKYGKKIIRPEYKPKKFIYEAKNDKDNAYEIVVLLKNREEKEVLDNVIKDVDINYNLGFVNRFPCVVYLAFKSSNACWGPPNEEDYKSAIKEDWDDNNLDGVYKKLFKIEDIKLIEKILREKEITETIRPTYSPKKFIYESFNSKEKHINCNTIYTNNNYKPKKFI